MLDRRQFMAALCLGTAGPAAILGSKPGAAHGAAVAPRADGGTPYRYLAASEARFIEAACDCLIPADASGPGASGAAVPLYLDRQLAGPWGLGECLYRDGSWLGGTPQGEPPSGLRPADFFRAALADARQELCEGGTHAGAAFEDRAVADRDAYLRGLAAEGRQLAGVAASVFLQMLFALTVEGFVSHPTLGTSRDLIRWPMQGFPGSCSISS
jgi:gluconate 2-dehydrogenase gamma chain